MTKKIIKLVRNAGELVILTQVMSTVHAHFFRGTDEREYSWTFASTTEAGHELNAYVFLSMVRGFVVTSSEVYDG